jgi:TonB family protein
MTPNLHATFRSAMKVNRFLSITFCCAAAVVPMTRAMAQDSPSQARSLVHRVDPEYPKIAKQTGAKGQVIMDVTVAPDGHVSAIKVVSGHPMLQNAAKEAVMQWTYAPQPTETVARVTLDFVGESPSGSASPSAPSGQIQQAVLISRKEPVYPEEAKHAGVTGPVVLQATIGKDGHVTAVKTLRGDPALIGAAEEAVRQWTYRPTLLNGVPVETQTQITLNFVGNPSFFSTKDDGMEKAQLIERREPTHPGGELATLGGTVIFRAKIGADGRLSDINVNDGPAELIPAALAAAKQWLYRPAMLKGKPVEEYTTIFLRFTPGR